jgi:hypothetical protein
LAAIADYFKIFAIGKKRDPEDVKVGAKDHYMGRLILTSWTLMTIK